MGLAEGPRILMASIAGLAVFVMNPCKNSLMKLTMSTSALTTRCLRKAKKSAVPRGRGCTLRRGMDRWRFFRPGMGMGRMGPGLALGSRGNRWRW